MLVASRHRLATSVFAALVSVAAFNFFFVPPFFTFAIGDLKHAVTFVVMFLVAVVISGLTERVRHRAEETQKARREVEAEQLRSSLLRSISHDLRTPLAVITGSASAFLESTTPADEGTRRELVQTILAESERLNRLIQNLLDMTRLESGTLELDKEWLPLEEIVGAVLNRADAIAGHRDLRANVPKDLPLVPFDAVLLDIALTNLLENALKYGADPVEISARLEPAELVVEVADRGPGIPEGETSRVFEKFHRASHEGGAGGVGLGLSICRAIVEAHGGRIWAQNRAGGGALFSLSLPITGEPPTLAPREGLTGDANP
jgi:two-component system sensor histidine kinase KdpD